MKPWSAVTIAQDITVTLIDDVENQFHGNQSSPIDSEAMYVDGSVWIKADATLDLNGLSLITSQSPTLGTDAEIVGGSATVVSSKTCYGDFDNDGDVDDDDVDTFCLAESGAGNDTDNILVDYDLDGDVDDDDADAFCANYNGADNDPRCACFPGGPGDPEETCPATLCP